MPAFRYRPAVTPEWLAIAAPGCLLAVRLEVTSERIEPLVALARGGSTVQELLDALTSSGLTNTPSFVLAFWMPGRLEGDGVGIVARGEGRALVSTRTGDETVEARGFASWTERHIDAVTAVSFELGDAGTHAVELELDGGSVWVSRITATDDDETPIDDDDPVDGQTIARPSRAVLAARAAAETPPGPPVPRAPAAPSLPLHDSSLPADTLGDHDGLTVLAEDLRAARQGAHVQAATPPSFAVQRYELELPSGSRQPLDVPVVLGRAPSVAGVPASALPHLVTLVGDDISRNHVRIAVEGGTVVVTDLHSSNGTIVVVPGRAPEKLRGGEPTPVTSGTQVDLGGGVTMRVRAV
ncbi:FHA domain-containing protein [Labedella populi]|uniref:FHA domain-containing protein n=1 Tax=Labedella populi TaxID=2498850 RepID=A0A444QCE5_9MICO|nr:FHA domain-containing protein [Labedella populi]RWZ64308.1 FHA domain-containing protein [Labedella populi]